MSLIIRDRAVVLEEKLEVEEELTEVLQEVHKRTKSQQGAPDIVEQRQVVTDLSKQGRLRQAEQDGVLGRLRKLIPSEVCFPPVWYYTALWPIVCEPWCCEWFTVLPRLLFFSHPCRACNKIHDSYHVHIASVVSTHM